MIFRLFLIGDGNTQSNTLLYSCSTSLVDLVRLLNIYGCLAHHCMANGPTKVHVVIEHFINFHRCSRPVLNNDELLHDKVVDVHLQSIFQDPQPLTDQTLIIFPDNVDIIKMCHQIEDGLRFA